MKPQPKKGKRVKNTKALTDYAVNNQVCQVCNAIDRPRDPNHRDMAVIDWPHHIVFKSHEGGDDHEDNLITMCRYHHNMSHGLIKDKKLTAEELFSIKRFG